MEQPHINEIIRIALENKMFESEGRTPADTLRVALTKENESRLSIGEVLRFCYVGNGVWGLTEWGLEPYKQPKRRR